MLRDRLACGINNSSIQKKLLGEHDLTFARALAIAEAADREMKPAILKKKKTYVRASLLRCGTTGHLANECRHKDKVCHNCGMKGRKTKPVSQDSLYGKTRTGTKPIRRTEEESSDVRQIFVWSKYRRFVWSKYRRFVWSKYSCGRSTEDSCGRRTDTITVRKVRPYKETVLFDEIPIEMELDSLRGIKDCPD